MHNIFIMFIILNITDFPFHQNLIRFIIPSISKYDLFWGLHHLRDFEFNFKERDHLDKNSLFSNVSERMILLIITYLLEEPHLFVSLKINSSNVKSCSIAYFIIKRIVKLLMCTNVNWTSMIQDHFKEAHLNQKQKTSKYFRRLWFDLNLWLRNFQFEIKYKFQGHYKLFNYQLFGYV